MPASCIASMAAAAAAADGGAGLGAVVPPLASFAFKAAFRALDSLHAAMAPPATTVAAALRRNERREAMLYRKSVACADTGLSDIDRLRNKW